MRKFFNIFVFGFVLIGTSFCQTKTNIEKLYGLIERSAAEIIPAAVQKENKVFVEFVSSESFAFLRNSLIETTGKIAKVNPQKENSDFILRYSIEEAKVKYGECFTKSFLGRHYVEREVSLKGFAGFNKPNENISTGCFDYMEKDTVEYSSLKELGNPAYPFSNPEIPSEPFFSNILEPFIAVGVAVTTVYLLFTVRSK